MSWITNFLTSSIGRKLIMSLTGLFLIQFLLVHLIGNLQLLVDDGGEKFNLYAQFMTTNPVIKATSFLLYGGILLHIIQGLLIWKQNSGSRNTRYAVSKNPNISFSSKYMGWLGTIILVFLILHLWQFWFRMKFGTVTPIDYNEGTGPVKDLYTLVAVAFKNPLYVIAYVIGMIVIGLHLKHGFQSSFQTLGLNHKKYTPLIKGLGLIYSILVPLGFAIIPIFFYFFR